MENTSIQILDAHVHILGNELQCVRDMLAFEKTFHYKVCNYLSGECVDDATQNVLGIYLKLIAPHCYAYGGLTYRYQYDFQEEMEMLLRIGFDGLCMMGNAAERSKPVSMPFNAPEYDALYAAMEEKQLPLFAHAVISAESQNPDVIFQLADVATRYPRLKIIVTHLLSCAEDMQHLMELMDQHPNVCIDLASGARMYFDFGKSPEVWEAFFLKYQDRIIYGTDHSNLYDPASVENAQITCSVQEQFLTNADPVAAWGRQTVGIQLPEELCRKIFGGNFRRLTGPTPRTVDRELAAAYLLSRLNNPKMNLTDYERKLIEDVLKLL